jgi:hypothetical protein
MGQMRVDLFTFGVLLIWEKPYFPLGVLRLVLLKEMRCDAMSWHHRHDTHIQRSN